MSNLEKYIRDNRAAFDAAEPSEKAWARGIQRALAGADFLEKFILENRAHFDVAQPPAHVWATLEASGKLGDCALETFLAENRSALDAAVPDGLRTWANIEKALPAAAPTMRVAHRNLGARLMRAAAVIALIVSGFGAGMWYAGQRGQVEGMAMSEVSSEYAELEDFYQRDIASKSQKLASFAAQRESVVPDLAQMDKAMEELRQELADVPPANREQVVRAMIDNYKAKSAILEKVLEHIQSQNHNQEQSNSVKHGIKNI